MTKVEQGLRFGPLKGSWAHLCIDMQRMFAEPTDWYTPWMQQVLPNVVSVAEINPARVVFTRFIPPPSSKDVTGSWKRYYQRWATMTRDRLDSGLIELVPELSRFVPPASIEDKHVMSPWHGRLHSKLRSANISTVVVTGAETEVCILATVMGAIDMGY